MRCHQGATAGGPTSQPLERLERRLWGSETVGGNTTAGSQGIRACACGVVTGAYDRVSPNTLPGFALAGRRHRLLARQWAWQRLGGPVPARRLCQAHYRRCVRAGLCWHDVTTDRMSRAACGEFGPSGGTCLIPSAAPAPPPCPATRNSRKRMAGLQRPNPMRCRMTRRTLSAMVRPARPSPRLISIGVL